MIHHFSIPARNPELVARILARFLKGKAYPFSPVEGGYIAMGFDDYGTAIEVYPIDTGIHFTPGDFASKSTGYSPKMTAFHAAISVDLSQTEIETIATEAGWRVQLCDRGPFGVIEVWVENWLMLELLTPELAKDYLEFTKPQNVEAFFPEELVNA
jgi:hypothetical protein